MRCYLWWCDTLYDDVTLSMWCDTRYVAQRYIENPYLVGGKKFDLRLYVLVTSYMPLTVWMYRSGFARFSNSRFSMNAKGLNDVACTWPKSDFWGFLFFIFYFFFKGLSDVTCTWPKSPLCRDVTKKVPYVVTWYSKCTRALTFEDFWFVILYFLFCVRQCTWRMWPSKKPAPTMTRYDDVTLCMMMWHYVWWCDTMYDDVTLCMMMWHYVWW
jgi:hypothetical protein